MRAESDFKKAERIKGYGSYEDIISQSEYKKLEKVVKIDSGLSVKPKIISSLTEYVDFIGTLDTSYENSVFYRGQTNANYLANPSALRLNPANEQRLIEAFSRCFSTEIDSCVNDMARLLLMQHYGLVTRGLDVSENPLVALYVACSPMKKFPRHSANEKIKWGEVMLFREGGDEEEKKPDGLKSIHSTTVSILSGTAFMENEFSLWKLGMEWKKDNIVHRSVIVRPPLNNPRIKNQQGAFILVNANEVKAISEDSSRAKELTEYILKEERITFEDLVKHSKWGKLFNEGKTWELEFKKIKPYSIENKIAIFNTDPFNLRRIYYKKDGVQQVVLIPPDKKEDIKKDLARFNITEDFIYPDMDCVANEINERVNV